MLDETHMSDEQLLAFADGRRDLLSEEAITHMQMCAECNHDVDQLVAARAMLRKPLHDAFVPTSDLSALVARVITTTSNAELARVRGRNALAGAGFTFAAAAFLITTSTVSSWQGIGPLLRAAQTASVVVRGLGTLVQHAVPGGTGALALTGAVFVATLYATGRTLVRHSATGALIVWAAISAMSSADAQLPPGFSGQWPSIEADARVSVDVTRKPMSYALERVSKSAKLDLILVSSEDPLVTLHLRNAPLQEVLAAIVAGRDLSVVRSATRLQIAEARADDSLAEVTAQPTTSPAPAQASPAPAQVSPAPAAPAAPVPSIAVPPPPPQQRFPSSRPSQGERATLGNDATVEKQEKVEQVVTMGGDATILGEVERDVVTMGGDATIAGYVGGDVVTMGGDLHIKAGSEIAGEVATMGGAIHLDEGATPPRGSLHQFDSRNGKHKFKNKVHEALGRIGDARDRDDDDDGDRGSHISDFFGRLGQFALLGVLGLLFLGVAPNRFDAIQDAIKRNAPRVTALGLVTTLGACIATVVFTLTLIGIPLALVVALALTLSAALGVTVAGYALGVRIAPTKFRDKPLASLAIGLGTLFIASWVPLVGFAVLTLATLLGIGAIAQTKLGTS